MSKFSLVPRCPFDAAALALIGDFLNFAVPNQNQEIMNKFIQLNSIQVRVDQIVGYRRWKTDTGVLTVDVYLSFPINNSHCIPAKMSQQDFENFQAIVLG